jgi:hypothetical protein
MQSYKQYLLMEITIQDHFEKFGKNFGFKDDELETYEAIAKFDPTSNDGKIKGKYTEWLLKMTKSLPLSKKIQNLQTRNMDDFLTKASRIRGFDINRIDSMDELMRYIAAAEEAGDTTSNRQKKKEGKDIFNSPDDITIIHNGDGWIVAKPETQAGNIMLARYKTEKSAKWCTADPDTTTHWRGYTKSGELYVFIPTDDCKGKFQIYVEKGKLKEYRDFNDDIIEPSLVYETIKELGIEDKIEIEPREPLVMTLDEYGAAQEIMSENGLDDHWEYLNRQPDEDEYDDDSYWNNPIYDITHYDMFLENCFEIYVREIKSKYYDGEDKLDSLSSFLNNLWGVPDDRKESDKEKAKEAVYDFYSELDEEFEDFKEEEGNPPKDKDELKDWLEDISVKFLKDTDNNKIKFAMGLTDNFPYNFAWEEHRTSRTMKNPNQLELDFDKVQESKLKWNKKLC